MHLIVQHSDSTPSKTHSDTRCFTNCSSNLCVIPHCSGKERDMSSRVFDLILTADSVEKSFGYDGSSIECIVGSGNNLFVGTSSGGIVSYSVQEVNRDGKVEISVGEWAQAVLPNKVPIQEMDTASALNRLFVLSDGVLYFLTLQDLRVLGTSRFKTISCFSLNQNPATDDPFTLQMAVGVRKKTVFLCNITPKSLSVTKEIQTEDIPLTLGYDGTCLCYATELHYYMQKVEEERNQPLFPINAEEMTPIIKRVGKEEFLLTGLQGLGVFANGEGVSNRPPLFWGTEQILGLAFNSPYVLGLGDQFITVHSVVDQEQKQHLPFSNGKFIGDFDGQIFVSTDQQIYKLSPISWEKQVEILLAEQKVEEALQLANTAQKTGYTSEGLVKMIRRLEQEAAFIELQQCKWKEASRLIISSRLDIREVMVLYAGILPVSSDFTRSVPPIHSIPNIQQITGGEETKVSESQEFLIDLLETSSEYSWTNPCKKEINTALVKLYSLRSAERVERLLEDEELEWDEWLEEQGKHHSICLCLLWQKRFSETMNLWKRMEEGEMTDEAYPGLENLAKYLKRFPVGVCLQNIEWIMGKWPDLGLDLIRNLHETYPADEVKHESFSEIMEKFPDALLDYLELLTMEIGIQTEKYHTRLALLFVTKINSETRTDTDSLRQRLRHFLIRSDYYRVRFVLEKLQSDSNMATESAYVLGKLGNHDEALNILVRELRDFDSAEDYCVIHAEGKTRPERQRIYLTLLRVYLSIREANDLPVAQIVRLLNRPDLEINLAEVLELLPSHWSLEVLTPFVLQSVRRLRFNSHSVNIGSHLAKASLNERHWKHNNLKKQHFTLSERTRCGVCNDFFVDAEGYRYPSGILVHKHCMRRPKLCPVTQEFFSGTT